MNMTITIEIIGSKKEIENYFSSKIYSKGWEQKVEKAMSKKIKLDVDLTSSSIETSICARDQHKYKLTLARYGPCELPKKKKTKH